MHRTGKLVNFRLPFAAAVSMACGVALSYALLRLGASYLWLAVSLPAAAAGMIAANLFSRTSKGIIFYAVTVAFFLFGAIYAAVILSAIVSAPSIDGAAQVTGVVQSAGVTSSSSDYIVLKDATAGGLPLGGKVIVYLSEDAGGAVYPGYTVTLSGSLSRYDLISYGAINYRVQDGILYSLSSSGRLQYSYGFSLFGAIRSGIYKILFGNLDYEAAAISYAMITGDTFGISEQTLDSFRYGGVAHIFAVSGMNITLLYMVVTALFRRLRVNRWAGALVSLAVVFVYTGVCAFALSAVRAAIMCAVASVASLVYRKYDGLNSLSVSVILILCVNPVNLFDIGFILSVSAMVGIIFLSPGLNRLLRRLPAGLRSNISMSLSSQVSTLPALLLTFGYISGAGLILNIVVLPLLSFLYVVIFACTALCAAVPPLAGYVLPAVVLPLQATTGFFVSSGFENSLISAYGGWWLAAIAFIGVAALSDKFNFRRSVRAAVGGICALCFFIVVIFGGTVYQGQTRVIAAGYSGGGMVLVRTPSRTSLILLCDTYSGGVETFVNRYAPGGVDDLIILGGEDSAAYYYECGISAPNTWLAPAQTPPVGLDGTKVNYLSQFTLDGTYYSFTDSYTVTFRAQDVLFAVSAGEGELPACDLAVTLSPLRAENALTQACFAGGAGQFDLYAQGCLQFIANGGKLVVLNPASVQ